MKPLFSSLILAFMIACNQSPKLENASAGNPLFPKLNEPIQYSEVTAAHLEEYAHLTISRSEYALDQIRKEKKPDFNNIFVAFDDVINEIGKAGNNCFMFYWVSPDSLSRDRGLDGYQLLDSLRTSLSADSAIYRQMVAFAGSAAYKELTGHRKTYVDDVMQLFEHAGVKLEPEPLKRFKELKAEISKLSSEYSTNMNTANAILVLDEAGAAGLPENFKASYAVEGTGYEIPVIPATRGPVLNNASVEETRRMYLWEYQTRASDENLPILDELVRKRYELARLMDRNSYATYSLSLKMAKNPETVWNFLDDLIRRSRDKALRDHESLKAQRNLESGTKSSNPVNPWDISYFRNQLLKTKYNVDHEVIREYLPMEQCLAGMLQVYEELLGLEIRRVEDPSVWHEEVLLYEVWDEGNLKGRFYLDLYPRPHKESWFYGVGISSGKLTSEGYEIPVCLLLANFTRPNGSTPSLLSHGELNTLCHEFGHIMETMSYNGEFSFQAGSKEDFSESMSTIFENWTWDYDILSTFARHYKTGEILPRALFDNMLKAKNATSGLDAQSSLRNCVYDMKLYDSYDPDNILPTDDLWRLIDQEMAVPLHVEGSHPQASWIHINTHPTYYYGYLWAEVYAQDMFTKFEENGLTDTETGTRYRQLILSNGTQRDIVESVEEFLGRPSNNEAYIRSLGLN